MVSQEILFYVMFLDSTCNYDNMPMQYTATFDNGKTDNFQMQKKEYILIFFLFLLKNIDCGYTIGGSNEYPNSMF